MKAVNTAKKTAKKTIIAVSNTAVKTEKTAVKKDNSKPTKVIYLAENVTAKQLQNSMIDANKMHKMDAGGFFYCLKRAVKFGTAYLENFKNVNAESLLSGKIDLIKFLTDSEKKNVYSEKNSSLYPQGKFNVWLMLQLIKRYAKNNG